MGGFSEELKERVRGATDIVDLVGECGVLLRRSGANFVGLCPFHREKTPSFSVSRGRQIFHCFGCGKGGDVFGFVMELERLSFPEAVVRLAERGGIDLPRGGGRGGDGGGRGELFRVHAALAERWHRLLVGGKGGEAGRVYLRERGVGEEAVGLFGIGFAPDSWSDVLEWGRGAGFGGELLERAGLVVRREGGSGFYGRFRGRLMFPIRDVQGRVVGFSGRLVVEGGRGGKYVNSPETVIFKKGRVLFGLDRAREAVLGAGCVVVCEGQLDVVACHVNGLGNVVAPLGTALTVEQGRVLRNFAEEVVLCFDGDGAGEGAVERAFDGLLGCGLGVRVACLPAGHDPDSLIRERGVDVFRGVLDGAVGFFEFLLGCLCRRFGVGSDGGRRGVVRGMASAVGRTGDAVLADVCAQRVGLALGVSADAVRREFGRLGVGSGGGEGLVVGGSGGSGGLGGEGDGEGGGGFGGLSAEEGWLLRLVLCGGCDDGLVEWLFEYLDVGWVVDGVVRRVLLFRLDCLNEGRVFGVGALLGVLGDDVRGRELVAGAAMVMEGRVVENLREQLGDIVVGLRNRFYDGELLRLGSAGLDEGECAGRVLELQLLKRRGLERLADV